MRLLSIALLSVMLFFPLYWALHPVLGPNWGAGLAAVMMYVGFPVALLVIFKNEWDGPVIKFCNYLIAILLLIVSVWVVYVAFGEGSDQLNAIRFFWFYGVAALYYMAFGRFHIKLKEEDET